MHYPPFSPEVQRLAVAVFADLVMMQLEAEGYAVITDAPRLVDAVIFKDHDGYGVTVNRSVLLSEDSIVMIPVRVLLDLCPHKLVNKEDLEDPAYWFGKIHQTVYELDLTPLLEARNEA